MGGVRRTYRRTWRDPEAPCRARRGWLGREKMGDPPGGPGGVGKPSRRAVRGQEALPE